MKRTLIIVMLLLLMSTQSYAKRPPKVESLADGYLIIGQYMIYRTQLTQENFDGALMTTSEVQKIYYKSEFANGTWFNVDESQELVEILMGGGGQTISDEWLNTLTYSVQIDEDGVIINFNEGDNAQPIQEVINALKAEQASLESDLEDLAGDNADEIAEQTTDVQIRINALNKSIGIDDSEQQNKQLLMELLAEAKASGNKVLMEAIQEELATLDPTLSDPEILIGIVQNLLDEKKALMTLKDQAQRNGFEELLEALLVELASKDAVLEEALLTTEKVVKARGTDALKEALGAVIAESKALALAEEPQVPTGVGAILSKILEINDDVLGMIFNKGLLNGSDLDALMVTLNDLIQSIELEDLEALEALEALNKQLALLKETEALNKQLVLLKETISSMLDPLLTVAILDKNQLFSLEEIRALTALLREELFQERQKIKVYEASVDAQLGQETIGAGQLLEEHLLKERFNNPLMTEAINNLTSAIEILLIGNSEMTGTDETRELDKINRMKALEKAESNLIELAKLLARINQPMKQLLETTEAISENQEDLAALVISIDQLLIAATSNDELVMIDDLKTLRKQLLAVLSEFNRDDYQDYITYKKSRYFLLKDYTSDKEKRLDTTITDYTAAIAELDKSIQTIISRKLIDLIESELEYTAWRLTYEGNLKEQKLAIETLERYRNNKKKERALSIEQMTLRLEDITLLMIRLETIAQEEDEIDYRIRILEELKGQTQELLDQLSIYYDL